MKEGSAGAGRLSTVSELMQFLISRRIWWMTPLVILLLLFGVLAILAEVSAVSPFIYALF